LTDRAELHLKSPPLIRLALPFGYPSTTLRASAQGPRSRRGDLGG